VREAARVQLAVRRRSSSGMIHVPSWPGRGTSAHAASTSANATSIVRRYGCRRIAFLRLRLTISSVGVSTIRGSGACHRIGSLGPYHGKMPWL
jgi:hypothetical protein